uniref:C1q-related factor-like n=1 Tax=Monopterus albus TaxID=43700 RepID=UPI0009B40306|nr:C1q-related factor-like [Monopterus albus]
MRAIVFLCLLHGAFSESMLFTWNGPTHTTVPAKSDTNSVCLTDQSSCGCCLIQKQMQRLEEHFNKTTEELNKEVTKSKTALQNITASRSAFSVALRNLSSMNCYGPFNETSLIIYKHVFINLGGSYNVQTGIFTVPHAGVYSLTITIYAIVTGGNTLASCANLQVNGQVVAVVTEQTGRDLEDSATAVVALPLKAGDQVSVKLLKGCLICDNSSHYNTFTGFLLYATD